jgi:hypothetical protein
MPMAKTRIVITGRATAALPEIQKFSKYLQKCDIWGAYAHIHSWYSGSLHFCHRPPAWPGKTYTRFSSWGFHKHKKTWASIGLRKGDREESISYNM